MNYDPKESMKIMTIEEARVYMTESRETVRKMAEGRWSEHGDIWQAAYFMVGAEYRTTPHLQLLAQEEIFKRNMRRIAA